MNITKEWIDSHFPEHGRTSCSDSDLSNGFFEIEEKEVRDIVVSREFKRYPRCTRCFLLLFYEEGIDPRIEVEFQVSLKLKQPEFEIKQTSK